VEVGGAVASLLELGAGFHPDFSGRENVYMNAAIQGLSRREVDARMDAIVAFSELESFIDNPVRTYSSGMYTRLGFAVASHVDSDVLLLDEVLAVGDLLFQERCVERVLDFKRRGVTIVFASHSLYDVRQLCDQAIWLDQGKVMAKGNSVFVTNEYSAFQRHHIGESEAADLLGEQFPNKALTEVQRARRALPRIVDARIYRSGTEEETYEITTGDSFEIRIWWQNPAPEETPIQLGVGFLRQDMTTCGGMGTNLDGLSIEGTEGCTILRVPSVRLLSGQFLVPILLLDGEGVHKYQEFLMPENLVVRTNTRDVGLFRLDHEWEFTTLSPPLERADAPGGEH
jgi:ABC-type multidrug transport system ATPase subunit